MIKRWKIVGYWMMINTALFMFFGIFMHPIVAANISMLITVSAFLHERNKPDRDALRRPTWHINSTQEGGW